MFVILSAIATEVWWFYKMISFDFILLSRQREKYEPSVFLIYNSLCKPFEELQFDFDGGFTLRFY